MRALISRLRLVLTLAVFFFFAFTATAFAAAVASPDESSVLELLRPIVDAVKNGQFALGGSFAVILLMALTKRYLPDRYGGRFARSEAGGTLSTFVYSFAGALAIALAPTGATVGAAMMWAAFLIGLGAAGGYTVVHKLATYLTSTAWWNAHAPAWLKTALAFVLGLFGSDAVKKAEAAGEAAVKANPPQGSGPTLGEPTDVA